MNKDIPQEDVDASYGVARTVTKVFQRQDSGCTVRQDVVALFIVMIRTTPTHTHTHTHTP